MHAPVELYRLISPYRARLARELPWLLRELEFSIRMLVQRPGDARLRQETLLQAYSVAQRAGSYGFDEAAAACREASNVLFLESITAPRCCDQLERVADDLAAEASLLSHRVTA